MPLLTAISEKTFIFTLNPTTILANLGIIHEWCKNDVINNSKHWYDTTKFDDIINTSEHWYDNTFHMKIFSHTKHYNWSL